MVAVNKPEYVEDTDWVMCCRQVESHKYKYYSGPKGACNEKTAWKKCNDYVCDEEDIINTDADTVQCKAGYEKLVNKQNTYGCKYWIPPGFSNRDCAGYSPNCLHTYCMMNSRTG